MLRHYCLLQLVQFYLTKLCYAENNLNLINALHVPLSFFSHGIRNATVSSPRANTPNRKTIDDTRAYSHDNMDKKTPLLWTVCTMYVCNGTDARHSHSFHSNPPMADWACYRALLSSYLDTFATKLFILFAVHHVNVWHKRWAQITRALLSLLLFVSLNSRILLCACTESTRLENKYKHKHKHTRLSGHGRTQIAITHRVPRSHFDLFNFSIHTPHTAHRIGGDRQYVLYFVFIHSPFGICMCSRSPSLSVALSIFFVFFLEKCNYDSIR